LSKDKDALDAANIKVVAISYDPVSVLDEFATKNELPYPLLSDEGSKTIDAYGIRNEAMDGKSFGDNDLTGIPHPGTYLLDKDGVVRAKLFLERYQDRHTTEALIEAAEEAAAE